MRNYIHRRGGVEGGGGGRLQRSVGRVTYVLTVVDGVEVLEDTMEELLLDWDNCTEV